MCSANVSVWDQFEGDDGLGHASLFHSPKSRELDEVLGDILHKIQGQPPIEEQCLGPPMLFLCKWPFALIFTTECITKHATCTRRIYQDFSRSSCHHSSVFCPSLLLLTDMESAVIQELEQRVLEHSQALRQGAAVAAVVDWWEE